MPETHLIQPVEFGLQMAGPKRIEPGSMPFSIELFGRGPPPESRERFVESYVFPVLPNTTSHPLGRPPLQPSILAELLLFVI
jgi:hypothetical protein